MNTTDLDIIDRVNAEREELTLDSRHDDVALTLTKLEGLEKRIREAKAALKEQLKAWVAKNGPLVIGDVRYVLVNKKSEKCRDLRKAIEGLYEVTGGDFETFCDTFSVNALKPGAARKVFGERFDEFFEVVVEEELETKKPKKELVAINEHFTGRRS